MSAGTLRCGHAKSEENTRIDSEGYPQCRTCDRARGKARRARRKAELENDAEQRRIERLRYRIYHLPTQLESARAKLARLEDEARRYGMTDLLEKAA